ARVFGKDARDAAGGSAGFEKAGLDVFNLLCTDDVIQWALNDLYPSASEEELNQRAAKLRKVMWTHYVDSVSGEHDRQGELAKLQAQTSPLRQELARLQKKHRKEKGPKAESTQTEIDGKTAELQTLNAAIQAKHDSIRIRDDEGKPLDMGMLMFIDPTKAREKLKR